MSNAPFARPWIVIIGGFLGSGKTSLILAAAQLLQQRGMRCAAILNDQGTDLVDRHHAQASHLPARAVLGGCFCCRLSDLVSAVEDLQAWSPDVIFAEPVGSCTDIAATVFGPLLEEPGRYRLAPFTVLVDPARCGQLLHPDADPDLAFLFQKQLQEADLVCLTKADLYPRSTSIPGIVTRRLSSKSGEGLSAWLDEILFGALQPAATTLDIDYARYAQAEAALAWLNLSFVLESEPPLSPALAVGPLMDHLEDSLAQAGITIVHLKIFASSVSGWLKASICANGAKPVLEGHLDASPAFRHELLINLRAKGSPSEVQQITEAQLTKMQGSFQNLRLECFSPAPPNPQRRVVRTDSKSSFPLAHPASPSAS